MRTNRFLDTFIVINKERYYAERGLTYENGDIKGYPKWLLNFNLMVESKNYKMYYSLSRNKEKYYYYVVNKNNDNKVYHVYDRPRSFFVPPDEVVRLELYLKNDEKDILTLF